MHLPRPQSSLLSAYEDLQECKQAEDVTEKGGQTDRWTDKMIEQGRNMKKLQWRERWTTEADKAEADIDTEIETKD